MMKAPKIVIASCATLGLMVSVALAQNSTSTESTTAARSTKQGGLPSNPTGGTAETGAAGQNSQFAQGQQLIHARSILGQEVRNTDNQDLGNIRDLLVNPQNGEVFAAIGVGNNRFAIVPWQAFTLNGTQSENTGWFGNNNVRLSLNVTKQTLQSGPTVMGNQLNQLNDPAFTQTIYQHYNVQPGAMGGAGINGLGAGVQSGGAAGITGPATQGGAPGAGLSNGAGTANGTGTGTGTTPR